MLLEPRSARIIAIRHSRVVHPAVPGSCQRTGSATVTNRSSLVRVPSRMTLSPIHVTRAPAPSTWDRASARPPAVREAAARPGSAMLCHPP